MKYQLPQSLREALKQPLGTLVNEKQLLEYIQNTKTKIVSVGDLVTLTLLTHDISPLFCIIDDHTRRHDLNKRKVDQIHEFGSKKITVDNPAGVITEELWDTINQLYENKTDDVLLCVNGEEDLAALPAIILAPSDVTIIYGMPDKGVVAVPATEHHKKKVKDILAKM
ncbi:MAG: DUF359 domain-containing protein [Candidatus Thermoplasmatota archaeon]|nr:DUF359 domain-containing protein [Candidatus Thermoplasmatota archaeon]